MYLISNLIMLPRYLQILCRNEHITRYMMKYARDLLLVFHLLRLNNRRILMLVELFVPFVSILSFWLGILWKKDSRLNLSVKITFCILAVWGLLITLSQ